MKNSSPLFLLFFSMVLIAGPAPRVDAIMVTVLPAGLAAPLNSSTNRGFLVRTAQAPDTNAPVANSYLRAFRQINDTLLDTNNTLVVNEAIPGTNADSSYTVDTINFEKDGSPMDVLDFNGDTLASFTPNLFPGIPGPDGSTENFAVEVVTFLTLKAGTNLFGISANADRTDANNDDGFYAFAAANPRDFFGLQVCAAEKNTSSAFGANQHLETQMALVASVAGIYPIRLLYWQTGLGANLQFYSIDPDTGTRVLVNDPNDATAVLSYIDSVQPQANAPYVAEVSPLPGSAGNPSVAPITGLIIDGRTSVNLSSVSLSLNGALVSVSKAKNGTRTTVTYSAPPQRTDPNNLVVLTYRDSGSVSHTNSWQFTIDVTGGNPNTVAGQWDFESGDLRATIGQDLQYLDPTFDGPTGSSTNKTQFGTTTSFGIPNINGQIARVMQVPGDLDPRVGYAMHHGIGPNGGGTKVNQYTLIMDVMVSDTGPGAASLLRIQPPGASDGDLFWQGNNFGQGNGGYNGTGAFTPMIWHRVVAAYDEAAIPPVVTKFVDGIKQDDWTANQGLDNPRRALNPVAYLFADGTPTDERRKMWVKSVQIRSGKLSDAQIAILGGPSALGIPVDLPTSTVAGQWDFERGDLSATIGKPLQYLDPSFDGPSGSAANKTLFGTCTSFGVDPINGLDANVMQVPGDLDPRLGYAMTHGIAPNGGGTRVNQYTLLMDVMVDNTGPGAASLLRIQPTGASDGNLFWQGNNFGQGSGGYNGTSAFTPRVWHRVVAAYDETGILPSVTKYVDAIFQDNWTANQGLDNPRRALLPTAYLFADGTPTDERRMFWVKSVQIRAGKMSNADIEALGSPTGTAIPVAVTPAPLPQIKILPKLGNSLLMLWPIAVTGYNLEASASLANPTWTAVSGVTNNSVEISVGPSNQFFRLHHQ